MELQGLLPTIQALTEIQDDLSQRDAPISRQEAQLMLHQMVTSMLDICSAVDQIQTWMLVHTGEAGEE